MRTISLAAGLIAVGVLAALPFRRSDRPIDSIAPFSIASGPLGRQIQSDAIDAVRQWPDRPGFNPSIAWQPQPMTFDTSPHSYEMPEMPEAFPRDAIEAPLPAPVQERFDAAVNMRNGIGEQGLLMPPVAKIEDRFVYTPPPAPPKSTRAATVQAASVIRTEATGNKSPTGRVYIREPQ